MQLEGQDVEDAVHELDHPTEKPECNSHRQKNQQPRQKVRAAGFPVRRDFQPLIGSSSATSASSLSLQNQVVDEPGLTDSSRQRQQRRFANLFDGFSVAALQRVTYSTSRQRFFFDFRRDGLGND